MVGFIVTYQSPSQTADEFPTKYRKVSQPN